MICQNQPYIWEETPVTCFEVNKKLKTISNCLCSLQSFFQLIDSVNNNLYAQSSQHKNQNDLLKILILYLTNSSVSPKGSKSMIF